VAIGTASILDDEPDLSFCGLCSGPVGEDGRCEHCEAAQCVACGRWDTQAEEVAGDELCSGCLAEDERERREEIARVESNDLGATGESCSMEQEHKSAAPLADEPRAKLRTLVGARGETAAAKFLGVSRTSVLRALSGLELNAPTRAFIEGRLAGLEAKAS